MMLVLTSASIFAIAVAAHFALTHVIHSQRYVRNAFLVFAAVCVAALPVAVHFGAIGALILYASLVILWNSYLVFFINLMNSVSLRMINEIDRSPMGSLSMAAVNALYSDEEALEARVAALVRNGFLIDRLGDGLQLTNKGAIFARFLEGARNLFGIDSFG